MDTGGEGTVADVLAPGVVGTSLLFPAILLTATPNTYTSEGLRGWPFPADDTIAEQQGTATSSSDVSVVIVVVVAVAVAVAVAADVDVTAVADNDDDAGFGYAPINTMLNTRVSTGTPPLSIGSAHDTFSCEGVHAAEPHGTSAMSTSCAGLGGTGPGVVDTFTGTLAPSHEIVCTDTVYSTPFVSPVTSSDRASNGTDDVFTTVKGACASVVVTVKPLTRSDEDSNEDESPVGGVHDTVTAPLPAVAIAVAGGAGGAPPG
jgi:hypothetical protein